VTTARILEDAGIAAVAVHGRTKSQGYGGDADWEVIAQVAAAVRIPVIGNGDIENAMDVQRRMSTGVRGVMIGRAAMCAPWIFREIKHFLATGTLPPPLSPEAQWAHILRHCRLDVERTGSELHSMQSMRTQLMHYSRGMAEAKHLRAKFSHVASLVELEGIAAEHLARQKVGETLLANGAPDIALVHGVVASV
jgi:tRNA-dihydrouridine synthase